MGKLTDIAVRNAKPKDKTYKLSDGEGLILEITKKGSKLWRWRYYFDGKEQMHALGKYPDVSLSEARQERDKARSLVKDGIHPTREKQIQKLRKTEDGENNFEAVTRKWWVLNSAKLTEKYAKQKMARVEQYVFPKIGALPITDITIPDVVAVIEHIAEHGTIDTAHKVKQTIGEVFRYASQRGMCTHNPAADMRGILPPTEEKHHACIPLDELPELLQKIESRKRDMTYYATKLMMLTFVRTNELIGARWEEIDWQKEEWHIPKERMKMRRPHLVPLSEQCLELLRELQKITGDREFIFFSAASQSKHISNGTVYIGLKRMGYAGRMTGHGFRTLASTILNEQRYAPDVIERQLAHAERDKIRDAYNRAEYLLERKKMMQDYTDYLDSVTNGERDNILEMNPTLIYAES